MWVAVDLMDHPERALAAALPWAERLRRRLHVVYASEWAAVDVHPPDPTPELAARIADWKRQAESERAELARLTATLPAGIRGASHFLAGHPLEVLADHTQGHDLAVVATEGRRGMERLLLGSVARRLVRHARCPVLVVARDDEPAQTDRPLDVLVPVDGSGPTAADWIRDHLPDSRLHLATVLPPFGGDRAEALDHLQRLANHLDQSTAELHVVTATSTNAGDALAELVGSLDVDLVALPTHGRTGLARLALGSVAERLVEASPRPVLVTRREEA